MKTIAVAGFVALMASAGLGAPARAAVTETFSFSNRAGWGTGLHGALTGQFTGTVEPDGFIQLADLANISISATTTVGFPVLDNAGLGDLAFFSYSPAVGASSLSFIASQSVGVACAGVAAVLGTACNPEGLLPPGIQAIMLFGGGVLDYTLNSTTVTPVPAPAPEPPAWAMLLLGFAGLGFAARSRGMFKPPRALASAAGRS